MSNPHPPLISTSDPVVMETVGSSLSTLSDVAVLHRLNRSAGRRDWYLVRRTEEVVDILGAGRPSDSFTFFLKPQLKIRGVVDEHLSARLRSALKAVPDYRDEILVGRIVSGQALLADLEGFSGPNAEDLEAWLNDHWGNSIAAGQHPPMLREEDLITVYVPDDSGVVEAGVY